MGIIVLVIVIIVVVLLIKGKGNQIDVSGDPCIDQIVEFVRAVNMIKDKNGISSWIDFYSSEKTIVCRFYDFDGSGALRCIVDYTNNSYPNKERMIEEFKKRFNEEVKFQNFPQGTQLEIQDGKEGTYQLSYLVAPMHQNSIHSYRSAVANAIRQAGVAFTDTDKKGLLDPNRVYII